YSVRGGEEVVGRVGVEGYARVLPPDVRGSICRGGLERLALLGRQTADLRQLRRPVGCGAVGGRGGKREPALGPRGGVAGRSLRTGIEVVGVGRRRPDAAAGEDVVLLLVGDREKDAASVAGGTREAMDVVGRAV